MSKDSFNTLGVWAQFCMVKINHGFPRAKLIENCHAVFVCTKH